MSGMSSLIEPHGYILYLQLVSTHTYIHTYIRADVNTRRFQLLSQYVILIYYVFSFCIILYV